MAINFVLFFSLIFGVISLSQATESVESVLSGCRAIKNQQQRTKCYDAVAAMSSKTASSPERNKSSQHSNFVHNMMQSITANLKDPSSVQWRNLFVSGDQMRVLCGEMNAKNSYGAYTGFRRFYATENTALSDIETSSNVVIINRMWSTMCGNKVDDIDVANLNEPTVPTDRPDARQKEKWISAMAQRNGCDGDVKVKYMGNDGARERFEAICASKTLQFSCEFKGVVSESTAGLPSIIGESGKPQPACWM